MQYARGCSHPLDIPFANHATPTTAIMMCYFSLIRERHGFKTPVRMNPHATGLLARRKIKRRIVIHHNKWIHALHAEAYGPWNEMMYAKTIPYVMRSGRSNDAFNLSTTHADFFLKLSQFFPKAGMD